MLTFKDLLLKKQMRVQTAAEVYLDGVYRGRIKAENDGFYYMAKNTIYRSDYFSTLDQCKKSLEVMSAVRNII